ncbi:MAG: rod shape-determining protein MreC [Bacteroidales bacterium]|nr:rod shape-determining protein MreC [Bacteroidales bacterium]
MRSLILFLWKHRYFLLFLILQLVAIGLIVSNNSFQRSKFISASNGVTGNILSLYDNAVSYFALKSANERLAQENARLRNKLKTSQILLDTNSFEFQDSLWQQHYYYQHSKVLNNSFQKRNNYLIISKGSKQGISTQMAVLGQNGIVGIVNSVSENFSSVISVLHSRSAIDAKLKNSGYTGTIGWDGKDYRIGQLKNIPSHVNVKIGDTVVTSGFSFIFPEGLMVGIVESATEIKGKGYYDIQVRFSQEFNKLEYVYVVTDLLREEEELIENQTNE